LKISKEDASHFLQNIMIYTHGLASFIASGIIGVYMSFVTLRTSNCMYASIIHGAVNIIWETPIFVSLSTQSVLLGPNPSGIIGMSVLLMGAVVLLFKLPKYKLKG
jgi:hypothetical protein